jgi:hypothetical protein
VSSIKAFHRITEGEFIRQLQSGSITRINAQELEPGSLKFAVVAVNASRQIAYVMRHGRVDEPRTWRLDNLAKFLRKHGVAAFETQFAEQ